jgi:hypothetical protein
MRYGNDIQDEEGYPAFAQVNKATGEAINYSLGQSEPVSYDTTDCILVIPSFSCTKS